MKNAWIKDNNGNIIVFPLAGYETMVVENRALALRLPFLVEGDRPDSPSGNVQLIISRAGDAREFANDILSAVERIEKASKAPV